MPRLELRAAPSAPTLRSSGNPGPGRSGGGTAALCDRCGEEIAVANDLGGRLAQALAGGARCRNLSEASRRLTDELKARHPEIPWAKVAGIGNVLRHEYEGISAPVMWKLVQDDLTPLEQVCREELAREQTVDGPRRP